MDTTNDLIPQTPVLVSLSFSNTNMPIMVGFTNVKRLIKRIEHIENANQDRQPQEQKDVMNTDVMSTRRNEYFFQKILELHFRATHKKLPCGETDITTDEFHAEIKEWNCYKEAIGQLVCYNSFDPRHELRIYLFGKYIQRMKDIALVVFKQQRIRPFEFVEVEGKVLKPPDI